MYTKCLLATDILCEGIGTYISVSGRKAEMSVGIQCRYVFHTISIHFQPFFNTSAVVSASVRVFNIISVSRRKGYYLHDLYLANGLHSSYTYYRYIYSI
jgi:hypothetical protein